MWGAKCQEHNNLRPRSRGDHWSPAIEVWDDSRDLFFATVFPAVSPNSSVLTVTPINPTLLKNLVLILWNMRSWFTVFINLQVAPYILGTFYLSIYRFYKRDKLETILFVGIQLEFFHIAGFICFHILN